MKVLYLFLVLITCAGCGVSELEVQVLAPEDATQRAAQQATAHPREDGFLYYAAPNALDLSFYYPQGWQVHSATNRMWISNPMGTLHIALGGQYRSSALLEYDDGLITIERDTLAIFGMRVTPRLVDIPTEEVFVLYSPRGGLAISNLRIGIWLETTDRLMNESGLAQVDSVLESMRFAWLATPPDNAILNHWAAYQDGSAGLALYHPPTWQISADEHYLELHRGDYVLRIMHGNLTTRSGLPAGEFRQLGGVIINGQNLPAVGLVYLERTKMILYGDPHTTAQLGEERVFAELETVGQQDYADIHIPESILQEAGQVLATLAPCCRKETD